MTGAGGPRPVAAAGLSHKGERNVRKYLMPALVALGLFAAGCGSDNSGSSGATTTAASGGATTTAAGGGASTTGAATSAAATSAAATSAAANKDPITIALLGIESGPNATDNRHNAIDLAV